MTLLDLLVALLLIVLIAWVVQYLIPVLGLPPKIAKVIYVICVVIFVLWFIRLLGVTPSGRLW